MKHRGFSLYEILLIVVIIGILVAVAMPSSVLYDKGDQEQEEQVDEQPEQSATDPDPEHEDE